MRLMVNLQAVFSTHWDMHLLSFSFVLFVVLFIYLFLGKILLCISGSLRTRSVDQCGLELTEIHLPLPPKC